MSTQPHFCSHCGAANPGESTMCFSCQAPLTSLEERVQETLLHERYRLLTQVGAGGFGGVYRALDTAEGARVVAVKQITLRGLSAQEVIEATDAFNREVSLLSNLRHPNLPMIHDTFTDTDHWYVVMDFIEGETLEAYLTQQAHSRLPLQEVLALGIQLCTVLHYLHTREPQIIFRDLKPSNVMRTANGRIYLIDFGIARHFTPGKPKDTIPFGSPGYAAPEQYGRRQTTPQADLYSLGALLHQLLTGDDPAESPFRFAPLPMADSTELAELDALIQRLVATEPEARPTSAAEVKATLQRLAEASKYQGWQITPAEAARLRPAPTTTYTQPTGVTRRKLLKGVAMLGTIAATVGGVVALGSALSDFQPFPHHRVYGSVAVHIVPGAMQSQFVYRGHTGAITALSWSPDGQYVASGSVDKTVQVWRAMDGALLYTLSGYDDPVTSIVWATDRLNVIASAGMSDGTVQVWDALRDHRDLIYQGDGRTLALDWQHGSPWMVSGGTSDEVYTWSADTGQKGASYRGHAGDVRTVAWLRREASLASTNGTTPAPTSILGGPYPGSQVASGGADGTVQIWDVNTGAHVYTYTGHEASVNGLAVIYSMMDNTQSPWYQFIVSASDDGTVQVWQPGTLPLLTTYRGHHDKVNAVATLPFLKMSPYYQGAAVSASEDHTVQVWSIESLTPQYAYMEHQAPVRAVATSLLRNNHRVVSGDADGLVHLWSISNPTYQ